MPSVAASGPGAQFVRADLHVHSFPDDGAATRPPSEYISEAEKQGISVLGLTDHNTISRGRAFVEAAEGHHLLVLPGMEITTHQGHLLALFAPDRFDELEAFATKDNLKFDKGPADGSTRSSRALLDLVGD